VILDVDRQVVAPGVFRKALGQGPRDQHAVVLEPEVPVQAASVMLLDDESRLPGLASAGLATGLRGSVEAPFRPIFPQVTHVYNGTRLGPRFHHLGEPDRDGRGLW
jgi:hypothetical protein